jgi:hypothetical protein
MNRWFNTAGPCQPEMHYMLPSMPRLPQLETLIDRAGYFVLHAPRQVGKTTAMLTIAQELTAQGKYTAVMASVEVGATFSDNPLAAQKEILRAWDDGIRFWLPPELHPPEWMHCETIGQAISLWGTGDSAASIARWLSPEAERFPSFFGSGGFKRCARL